MHIHFLQVRKKRSLRSNKDTNGGFGTVNDFGSGLVAVFLKHLKRRTMNYPEILPAYTGSILRSLGHKFTYGENQVDPQADIVLIQTSIVNYFSELIWADQIKSQNPGVKVGFVGGMAAGNPHLYDGQADFVIQGESENFLLNQEIGALSGIVDAGLVEDLDALPFPEWSHIGQSAYNYRLGRRSMGRFLPMLASRGCPMPCRYYCTYPLVQGQKFRARSPENVVAEMIYLKERYNAATIMFRDPIFSLKMERVARICELIIEKNIHLSWIMETHPRFLTPELIELCARAGCVAVKLGIESGDLDVMEKSLRTADLHQQEQIVRSLESNAIQVLAFYILGYFDDTHESVHKTIKYAAYLNTYGAQFTIATPYPGTQWYKDIRSQGQRYRLDENLENYNQYHLVYDHPHLDGQEAARLKSLAYQRYYLRWPYIRKHIMKRRDNK
ncbi:B12-binding domain-containing radical SAM protein [Chloroflexota bacterium]